MDERKHWGAISSASLLSSSKSRTPRIPSKVEHAYTARFLTCPDFFTICWFYFSCVLCDHDLDEHRSHWIRVLQLATRFSSTRTNAKAGEWTFSLYFSTRAHWKVSNFHPKHGWLFSSFVLLVIGSNLAETLQLLALIKQMWARAIHKQRWFEPEQFRETI